MLDLASAVLAMYLWLHSAFNMGSIPQPVIVEHGTTYSYNEIYSAITVPDNWTGTCDNQRQLLLYMERHFNAFRNGNRRLNEEKLQDINKRWVCVQ